MDAVYLQNRYRRLFNIRFRNGVHYVSGPRLVFGSTADARGFYHSFSPDKKLTLQKLCRTTSPNAVVAALQRGQLKVYLPRGTETVGISLLRTAIRPVLAAIIAHEKTDAMAFFLVCSKGASNVGVVHERLHRLIRTQLETSWYKCWEDPRAWHGHLRDRLEAVGYKVLVDALGFDAGRVPIAMITEAYEIALLIGDHDETRVALECFLRGYSRFQHGLNTTQFTGGALFEIILTAVLAMLTDRAGLAGTATGRQPPVVSSLKRLGSLLQDLAERLRHVKLLGPGKPQQAAAVGIPSKLADYAIEGKVPKPNEPPRPARVDTATMPPGKGVPNKLTTAQRIAKLDLEGHAPIRHGGPNRVTGLQLEDRAVRGIDPASGTTLDAFNKFPDGSPKPHKVGRNATAFTSDVALLQADDFARSSTQFQQNITTARTNGDIFVDPVEIPLRDVFGSNYQNYVRGVTRLGSKNNPTGHIPTDFTDGTIKAIYRLDQNGSVKLHTLYPNPKS